MATHIVRTTAWNPPAYKYRITLDADFDVVSIVGNTATIRIVGNYIVDQSEHDSEMVAAPASDYGFLFEGEVIPAAPTEVIPGDHYMEALPTLFGGSAEQYRSAMLLEFRGDTYRADGGNFTNLWTKSDGLVINRKFGNTTTTIPLDITITVDVSDGGRAPVLSWSSTYVTFDPTVYHWGDSEAWVSWVDLDYRPHAVLGDSKWLSHNRAGGTCHLWHDNKWHELRTIGAPTAMGNPPSVYHDGKWYNGSRIGKE